MNGAICRAAAQAEGHLAFGENGLAIVFRKDDGRAVERIVVARPIVAERVRRGEVIAECVTLSDDRRSVISGIGIERAGDEARDAHAADQLQGDEQGDETAEHAAQNDTRLKMLLAIEGIRFLTQ